MDGVEFLVLQAALSFEWWTGLEAPFDVMLEAARKG
jgi:shikimate 5-dehydrogenase